MENKNEVLSNGDLGHSNIVAVKVKIEKRTYLQTLGEVVVKKINRTSYLKICWYCGHPYESHKFNASACSQGCSQNLLQLRKKGYNPFIRMNELLKERNTQDIRDRFGYR